MKKYLINGALALIVGFTYTSCKNNDVDYVPIAQQKTQAYAEAFKEMIGGEVDPNQNWGFETITISEEELAAARAAVRAGTRTTIKEKHDWESRGITKPTPLTETERQDVRHYFNTHKFSDNGTDPKLSEYWVEFVSREDTSTVMYHKNGTVTSWGVRNFTYDQFSVESKNKYYIDPSGYEQVNDWNGDSHPTYFLEDVGTSKFRIWLSYTSEWNYNYTIQSYKGNLYVAFDLYGSKWNDNGEEHMGETSLGYYNDYIVRLIPKDSEPEEITNVGGGETTDTETITNAKYERKKLMLQGRVFCEDLAKATRADIDFNDIVFDARIWRVSEFTKTNGVDNNDDNFLRYEAEICLLAAGGTIPANVASQDVHDLFGVGLTTMVNTVDGNSNVTITWGNSDTTRPVKNITFNMTELITNNNGDISLDLIPIEVMWTTSDTNDAGIGQMKSVGHLGANVGDVPYKFCAPIGTPWASERNSIVEVYSGFADWAKGGSEPNWGNGTNLRYNNCPNGLSTDSKYVIGYTEEKQISSTSTTTTEIETVLWQGSRAMEYSADGNNGKYAMVFNSKDIKVGDKLRIYGTKSTGNATLVLKNNENGWQDIVSINLSDLNNYKEIDVTEGMVNAMTSTTVNSWGRGCSITKITRWRKTVTTN